jgi:hypothetical protein
MYVLHTNGRAAAETRNTTNETLDKKEHVGWVKVMRWLFWNGTTFPLKRTQY